jgi:hypothetical protein
MLLKQLSFYAGEHDNQFKIRLGNGALVEKLDVTKPGVKYVCWSLLETYGARELAVLGENHLMGEKL